MSGKVVELRKSVSPALRAAVEKVTADLDASGRVTGFVLLVFAEDTRGNPITQQVAEVPHMTLAIGALALLQADLIDDARKDDCPECGA